MSMKIEDILAECIEDVKTGRCSVEDCLAKYPSVSKQLEPLLRLALEIREPPDVKPSTAFKVKARVQLMEQIQAMRGVTKWRGFRYSGQRKPILYKRRFNMVAIIVAIVLAVSALGGGTVYASQDSLPGDVWYPVKLGTEQVRLVLTTSDTAKVELCLTFANSRLEEMAALVEKEKPEKISIAVNGYEEAMAMAIEKMEQASGKGLAIADISELVAAATSKHLSVLDKVGGIVPEEAKGAIAQAKGVSINGLGNALRALAGENPERAMEINLAAVEGGLNRARANAEDNDIEGLEDDLDDFEELNKFGEEISVIARGLGKDTTVEQLVGKATSIHLKVLALVWEKVPDQAKPAIERAIATSARGHERAVTALEGKGALGDIPKEPPIPAGIQQELADTMLAWAELQKQATDFNLEGGIRNGIEIAPALNGDEDVEIDGVVKTTAEWYDEAMDYLDEALAAYEAGDYAEAKEKAELAKDIFDALNNLTGQTIGFWNLEGEPEGVGPPDDAGPPDDEGEEE